jgi:hypothetical protein
MYFYYYRYWRDDTPSQSLHYFHSYAVRDRINLATYSDAPPVRPTEWTMSDYLAVAQQVLPHSQDEENLHNNFIMLVARTFTHSILPGIQPVLATAHTTSVFRTNGSEI